jgi:hypothetical protein
MFSHPHVDPGDLRCVCPSQARRTLGSLSQPVGTSSKPGGPASWDRSVLEASESFVGPDLVIGQANRPPAVDPLQAAHREMPPRHRLEVIHEGGVDRSTAERTEHRHGLGGGLLGDHHPEAGSIWLSRRTTADALSSITPRPATCCTARVTDRAMAARTAK